MKKHNTQTNIRRGPDELTALLAGGSGGIGPEKQWVTEQLEQLRPRNATIAKIDSPLSLRDLKRIYLGARVVQGSVIASQLALPAVVEAGETLRGARLPEDIEHLALRGAAQVELFLNGSKDGVPRESNDFPDFVKRYISAIAGMLDRPYARAFARLQTELPELYDVALDADELQRLCWGYMRSMVSEVLSQEELRLFREKPIQSGTKDLLKLIKDRTGVALPPRIMQRDSQDYISQKQDWLNALQKPRQDPKISLLSGIRFSVENAEISTLYCIGSQLVRLASGMPSETVLRCQIKNGIQDIAWGTHMVTHNARFQSRVGARPNYYRSFNAFLKNVRKHSKRSPVQDDGKIDWFDTHEVQIRGWCPAQNMYETKPKDPVGRYAQKGRNAIEKWQDFSQSKFGVAPDYSEPTAGELLASLVLFTTLHDDSPLHPGSPFMTELAASI